MKRILVWLAVLPLVLAFNSYAHGACKITGEGYFADMRDPNCHPRLDTEKCAHYGAGNGVTVGAVQIDVDDAKAFGKKVMNYANARVCEDRPNCGPYVLQFQSEAKCDGEQVKDMPGGEYRGLTANKARQILEYSNRQVEQLAARGEERGKKGKGKGKGRLWGND